MPDFIEPMKPTPVNDPPEGSKWVHEIKFDGYRTQAHIKPDGVTIYTSNGNNITERFSSIAHPTRTPQVSGSNLNKVIDMQFADWVGYAAGALTAVCQVPQILKILREREAHDVS